jgi:hypothetical protein
MLGFGRRAVAGLTACGLALTGALVAVTGSVVKPRPAAAATCTTGTPGLLEIVQECFGRAAGPLWQTTNHVPWVNGNLDATNAGVFVSDGTNAVPSNLSSGGLWKMTLKPTQDAHVIKATIAKQATGAGVIATVNSGGSTITYELVNNGAGAYAFKRNGVTQGVAFGTAANGDTVTLGIPSASYPYAVGVAGGGNYRSTAEASTGFPTGFGIESTSSAAAFSMVSVAAGNGTISTSSWYTDTTAASTAYG